MPSLRKRRVIVVTGSPNPHNLVAPAAPIKIISRLLPDWPKHRWTKDEELVEEMQRDGEPWQDMFVAQGGMPLADFECRHGSLPHDRNISCHCWGRPIEDLQLDLRSISGRRGGGSDATRKVIKRLCLSLSPRTVGPGH